MKRRCIECKKVIESEDAVIMSKPPKYKDTHPFCKECAKKPTIKEWF